MGVGYRVDVPPLYYVAPVSVLVHYWDHLLEGVLAQHWHNLAQQYGMMYSRSG